jgi:hypothetical protein
MNNQVLWTIVGAASGAILSLIASVVYEHAMLLKRPSRFFGKWHSSWQPSITPGWNWVNEDLFIERRYGKIFLRNENNSGGFPWRGKARLVGNKFLVGEWKSLLPSSQLKGTFTLAIGYNGSYMCGFFFAPDMPTPKLISAFVLGRKPEDVETGKRKLMQAKIVYPR